MAAQAFLRMHLLHSLTTSAETSLGPWSNSLILNNCDLHFIFPSEFDLPTEIPTYFDSLQTPSIHTPILLSRADYNEAGIHSLGYITNHTKVQSMSRRMVVLVNLNLKPMISNTMSYYFLQVILHRLTPHYVFGHVSDPEVTTYYYQGYSEFSASSKLILWNSINPNVIYIPCIPCSTPPIALDPSSMQDIDTSWDSLNNNMHRKILKNSGVMVTDSGKNAKSKCGPEILWYRLGHEISCTLATLAEKYNLSLSHGSQISETEFDANGVGTIWMGTILLDYRKRTRPAPDIYRLKYEPYEFVVVTDVPKPLSSFNAFISPLDKATWVMVLSSCVTITTVIRLKCVAVEDTYQALIDSVGGHIFRVVSHIFNQNCGNIFPKSINTRMTQPLMGGWIFACFILMHNVYNGEIFSCLTVRDTPKVPKTMEGLAVSKIRILTTAAYYLDQHSSTNIGSILKHDIIPDLFVNIGKNSTLSKLISILDKKTVFISIHHPHLVHYISRSLPIPFGNKTFPTAETFAIMDDPEKLAVMFKVLPELETRYVVQSRDDETPFNVVTNCMGIQNFLFPKIYGTFVQLSESGIISRWEAMTKLKEQMYSLKNLLPPEKYSGLVVTKLSSSKISRVNPRPTPVSLQIIKFVVALCAFLAGTGSCVLIWECSRLIRAALFSLVSQTHVYEYNQ